MNLVTLPPITFHFQYLVFQDLCVFTKLMAVKWYDLILLCNTEFQVATWHFVSINLRGKKGGDKRI